ncbi:MAG: class I SAM-dependent methyltransferase [Spirochaetales bacterium]|nr:class I SAM-dependent methyltransferase [Spirochaetales bacterium]
MSAKCPLCNNSELSEYHRDKNRPYLHCSVCDLVFVPEEFQVSPKEEKRIYDLHENDPYDPGYRRFLSRLCIPLLKQLGKSSKGLDFGCGPGPALALMLQEKGHRVDLYDLYYYNNPEVFDRQYDFICATEVLEHLKDPAAEVARLLKLLKTGGTLAVMTKLVIDRASFARWHYIQDRTHISFFSRKTFEYLDDRYDCTLRFIDKDVIFLQKQ